MKKSLNYKQINAQLSCRVSDLNVQVEHLKNLIEKTTQSKLYLQDERSYFIHRIEELNSELESLKRRNFNLSNRLNFKDEDEDDDLPF